MEILTDVDKRRIITGLLLIGLLIFVLVEGGVPMLLFILLVAALGLWVN